MLKIFKRQVFSALGFFILFFICKFIKIGPIFGAIKGNFLASQVVMPISGMLTGGFGIISLFVLSAISNFTFKFSLYSLSTVYHIPSFFASLALFTPKNRVLNLLSASVSYIIPLTCAALFIANPIGAQIPAYTLYWVIPVVIAILGSTWGIRNLFLNALRSTFIAHAVGTVIFIYSVPSDLNLWANLAKIVWLERLLLAGFITAGYKLIVFAKSRFGELARSAKLLIT
jgi:hypothetical protein